jgi:4-amino-4-deoxy-L-arabinose transferase-like glycosyltransferase
MEHNRPFRQRPFPGKLLLLLIILLWAAFWLRLLNTSGFSFWTDEGLTPLRASYPLLELLSNRITIQLAITKDTHPPLFYLIIHFTRQLFGETDFAYRYPSLLASLLLIPLLFQFGRRLHHLRLGILVALVTAVNPLQIWYANEARMYTLLVLLTAAATYVLWQAITLPNLPPPQRRLRLPHYVALYALLAGLAFYTHYTTLFLIAGQSLFWLQLLWQRGHKKLLIGTAVFALLCAIPVIPFTIPRLFTGAEANYYYVPPTVMFGDVVRFFHLGRSVPYGTPAIIALNIGAAALLLLGLYAPRRNQTRAFLLVYLLAVVLGLMAGSILKPMYQGVRHIMIGSPAFILIVSWGILFAAEQARTAGLHLARTRQAAWGFATALGLLIVIGGSALAIERMLYDPAVGKDDFRAMIAFIEERAGPHDVIIYNNAILLPLHDHYQQREDVAVTAVPVYPHLASEVAIPHLEQLAEQFDRIWFVTNPPADGRDDDQITQQWLDQHLTEVGRYLFPAQTVEVRTIAYETVPRAQENAPANGRSLHQTWPNTPTLTHATLQPGPPTLWLDLFWQGDAPTPETALRFTLQDSQGQNWWADVERPLMPEHTTWPNSPLVRQSYNIPLPPGTPPGNYTLLVQPLTQLAGNPTGNPLPVAELTVPPSNAWPQPPTSPALLPALLFTNGFTLEQLTILDDAVRPGHNLPLILTWHTGSTPAANLRYELAVIGPNGEQLRTQTDPPGARWLTEYPPDTLLRERTGLYFPPDTAPGTYQLRWQLRDDNGVIPVRPYWNPLWHDTAVYGQIQVQPWPLVTDPPTVQQPVDAQFGPDIRLHGYNLTTAEEQVQLDLIWQATAQPTTNYFVFIHLVDAAGNIIAQRDVVPVDGLRPTAGWRSGEYLTDSHTLTAPPGPYTLRIGLYQPDSFLRPAVTQDGLPQPDNQLILQPITIPGNE